MSTEKDLFSLINQSDKKAFEILFRLYFQPLKAFALKFIEDVDIAEGIVQETFIQIWEHRSKLENMAPKSYLYRMVKNRSLNHIRHQEVKGKYTQEILHTQNEWEEDIPDNTDKVSQILECVDKLPEQCKKIFVMNRMHGLKHAEIAEELNISVKTVKNHIGKALKILRNELNAVDMVIVIGLLKLFSEKL